MLYRTDFDENGRKTLCQMDGVNADMLMDIFVQKLAPGDTLTLEEAKRVCRVAAVRPGDLCRRQQHKRDLPAQKSI